ncbi:alpha/beta fold hydrolase [Streptantibioticus ferralitis]|uniref:Alpha/beta hydrolase n=1 Tax=Streptantibioticus ferralitis TaxID=236510 RepID=A0ABT5YZJ1_9ACTN|nr:alpha/beta hydrolase [Streptantibioticus ferralitis]MDF2257014.1 alpha/beta hydrolase [Streptantibioticus ferralitis]
MVEHHSVNVNGIRLHIAEEGEGPLVVLLHGFPECWYSWRHQFAPLAAAGYRVVAVDQRGYGRSDHPQEVEAYTILHLVGDVIGLIHALGEKHAVVIGHDWGAPVAWHTALLRPDVVTAVAGLSVPPQPRGSVPPLRAMRERFDGQFYWNYFETPGVADAELAADPRATFRRTLYGASGDNPHNDPPGQPLVQPGGGFLDRVKAPEKLPSWLTEEDIDVFTAEYAEAGFTGGLNWYRNLDRNWELTAAWADATIQIPALYITGDRDLVYHFPGMDQLLPALTTLHPQLREPVVLPGCGHWTQQERPDEVNAALLEFLDSL